MTNPDALPPLVAERITCALSQWRGDAGCCQWCNATITAARRRTWCSDVCGRAWQREHIWRFARATAKRRAKYRCLTLGDLVRASLTDELPGTFPIGFDGVPRRRLVELPTDDAIDLGLRPRRRTRVAVVDEERDRQFVSRPGAGPLLAEQRLVLDARDLATLLHSDAGTRRFQRHDLYLDSGALSVRHLDVKQVRFRPAIVLADAKPRMEHLACHALAFPIEQLGPIEQPGDFAQRLTF